MGDTTLQAETRTLVELTVTDGAAWVTLNGARTVGLVWDAVPRAELDQAVATACAPLRADPALARAIKASLTRTTTSLDAWAAATRRSNAPDRCGR